MTDQEIRSFRENLRKFERELSFQNNNNCCCGVTLAQCHILMELCKSENLTVNGIAGELNLDKSTVSRTVESLVNSGLVERSTPDNNRRITHLNLTEQGRTVSKQINTGNDSFIEKVMSAIPKENVGVFFESFEKMVSKMIELNYSTTN